MHRQPHFQLERKRLRQQPHKIRATASEPYLANADPKPGTQDRKLRQITIAAQREHPPFKRETPLTDRPDKCIFMIEANEAVPAQISDVRRRTPEAAVTGPPESHGSKAMP
jgi:hypothetical protein